MSRGASISTAPADVRFSVYTSFNGDPDKRSAGLKRRLHSFDASLFPSDSLPDRLARALAAQRVMHLKELLESFEFFARVRRRVRRPVMVDMCAGHGLTGILFALCERDVQQVILLDERVPGTFERVLLAVESIAPWVRPKVRYESGPLAERDSIPKDAGSLLVHACGHLTDIGLELAIASGGPVAALPCCYAKAHPTTLRGLKDALGREVAADVARTYRLHDAGYQVDWTAIPRAITPMNRALVAWNRGQP